LPVTGSGFSTGFVTKGIMESTGALIGKTGVELLTVTESDDKGELEGVDVSAHATNTNMVSAIDGKCIGKTMYFFIKSIFILLSDSLYFIFFLVNHFY
jgi:hypothetical protein